MAEERLQKIMARAGIASRRASEEIIAQGRVTVNGEVAKLGQSADPARADIRVDGQRLHVSDEFDYIMLNKPKGVISDEDVSGEHANARDLIPLEGHLYPVGRLDLESEGLMLFTNDGDLAHRLTHPRYDHPKVYHTLVAGSPSEETLAQWRTGVYLEGRRTRPAEVKKLLKTRDGTLLKVTLFEGRKRQIRKVAAAIGHPVISLIRVGLGPLELGNLPTGAWRRLTPDEAAALRSIRAAPEKARVRREAARSRKAPAQGGKPVRERSVSRGYSDRHDRSDRPPRSPRGDRAEGVERPRRPASGRTSDRPARPVRPGTSGQTERTRRPSAASRGQRSDMRPRPTRPGGGTGESRPRTTRRPTHGERPSRSSSTGASRSYRPVSNRPARPASHKPPARKNRE